MWVSFRLCLRRVVTSFSPTFPNSLLSRNLPPIPCLVLSGSDLYGILWGPCLGSCLYVRSARSRFIFAVLLLFLLVRGLSLSLLDLLLVHFPRML